MSENKIIKTTVVADTSSYRKGMQDAAKENDDFSRKAQGAAAPARELGAALESTAQASKEAATSTGTMNASLDGMGGKWRQVAGDARSFVEQMRSATGAMESASLGADAMAVNIGAIVQAAGLVTSVLGTTALTVGGLAVVMAAATRESAAMQLALDATSNYAGQTVASMRAVSVEMADSGKLSIGTAKDITTQLVSSGKIGQGAFESISLAAADFARVTLTMTHASTVVYSRTLELVTPLSESSFYAYCFDPITRRSDVALWDLPAYPDATLRVQVTQPGGTAAVGMLVVGRQRKLGDERWNPKFGIEDYSKKTTDGFGGTTFKEGAFAKLSTVSSEIRTQDVDTVHARLAAIRAQPVVWDVGGFEAGLIFGRYRSFSVVVPYVNISYCDLEIEGLT